MMILHVFRVYLTGGFKKPRELTWVTGVVLTVLTASFGLTGYSLPRDKIGYWAVKIVTGVPEDARGSKLSGIDLVVLSKIYIINYAKVRFFFFEIK
ncbi:cytochrome b6 [Phtheirospermum japonicum]|uniref:Cytochrome b6 n=1 Tax=Phtheirospermum japonicum TaxID=374723 RepID=A0A830CB04_9LAMI|nr:cytochrome b6 [Phtheirospermum japonicum]